MNTALSIHNIVGEFFTADEIADSFEASDFKKVESKSDAYAQIVVLERK